MADETMGICGVFLLTVVLLLLHHGLMLIGKRSRKPRGIYITRLNDSDHEPELVPDGEGAFTHRVATDAAALSAPVARRD